MIGSQTTVGKAFAGRETAFTVPAARLVGMAAQASQRRQISDRTWSVRKRAAILVGGIVGSWALVALFVANMI